MIDPKTVLIATPTHDGKVEAGYAGGLAGAMAAGYAGSVSFLMGNSDIGAARCHIAHQFLQSPFEWLVCIDADIQFSVKDFGMLMSVAPDIQVGADQEWLRYSRLGDKPGELISSEGVAQFQYAPELAVCAEYARKTEGREPVRFGLGFARIHRSVFERLNALNHEDGTEAVEQFMHQGQLVREYYPMVTMGDGRRCGEDGGFWTLVRLAGITPRIEQTTRLIHWGRQAYPYLAPGMGSAQ